MEPAALQGVALAGFEKEIYFNSVRASLFSGSMSQQQVMGQNFILREWRKRYGFGGDHRWLAYNLPRPSRRLAARCGR